MIAADFPAAAPGQSHRHREAGSHLDCSETVELAAQRAAAEARVGSATAPRRDFAGAPECSGSRPSRAREKTKRLRRMSLSNALSRWRAVDTSRACRSFKHTGEMGGAWRTSADGYNDAMLA